MSFPATNWTKLAKATLSGDEEGRKALEWICKIYERPVELAIRASGVADERVEDVRQDFFIRLIQGGFFRKADSKLGKFRNFLLHALQKFLIDDKRRIMSLKRGGNIQKLELTEDSAYSELDEQQFDVAWAEALFRSAVYAVGEEVELKRGSDGWKALRGFLTGSAQPTSYADLGLKLGLSEGGARSEVSRLRAKFRDKLRGELWLTVSAPHEVDEELSYLSQLMLKVWGKADV